MKLSIIIVNYNVKAYLEQCLRSVLEALKEIEGEVFVVDNLSTDGSVEMVRAKFPGVILIANKENVGFSRANNQAIRASSGEYVLLLNPDTVVGEDVFVQVAAFMDAHPAAGGLGVKMIDGRGRFLPESKRGLPTPTVAFFKIIGLSRLFPHSRLFGRYHLGHLPEDRAAPIEILSGACMFLRKTTLDKVGLLDESFFMYGEDIDLSYRITLGGYENWYFPTARIIHYKGESTKKSSVNYVFVFYNAMAIFARKHFARRGPQLFSLVIRGAIYLSAATALVARFLRGALLPLLDATLLVAGTLWLYKNNGAVASIPSLLPVEVLGAALVMALFGAYDRPLHWGRVWKGTGVLCLLALAICGWSGTPLPQQAIYLLMVAGVYLGLRTLLFALRIGQNAQLPHRANILAAGSVPEAERALALLWQTHYGLGKAIVLDAAQVSAENGSRALRQLVKRNRVDEVVFCAKDLSMQRIILIMEQLRGSGAIFKIAQPASGFIIGPSTTESLQDLLVLGDHAVNDSGARRRRRTLDILLALLFLATAPVVIWFVDLRKRFLHNTCQVLKGTNTWIGYTGPGADGRLPKIRTGILDVVGSDGRIPQTLVVQRMNMEYAKDYRVWKDFWRVLRNFRRLGGPLAKGSATVETTTIA